MTLEEQNKRLTERMEHAIKNCQQVKLPTLEEIQVAGLMLERECRQAAKRTKHHPRSVF